MNLFNKTPGDKARRPATLRERRIYAILDTVSNDLMGTTYQLAIHSHDAAAIRWFSDACHAKDTALNLHPEDYELLWLGVITDTHGIEPQYDVIFTGKQWLAIIQQQKEGK